MRLDEVFQHLGIPFCLPMGHRHVRQGWYGLDCPWCPRPRGDKGKWKLGVEAKSGRCNCWTCGGHNLQNALSKIANTSPDSIQRLLEGVRFKKIQIERRRKEGEIKWPEGVGELLHAHKEFLHDKGYDPYFLEKIWGLRGIGLAAALPWRIFIPVHFNGEAVSWTTRSIGKEKSYISAKPDQESIPIKETLYGIDLVRNTIIICEGPSDAWKVGPGAVATFGVKITNTQLEIMSRFPRRIVCFDNDKPGRTKGRQLAEFLSMFPGETFNITLDADDPGSANDREISLLRKAAFGE